jgi:hypothetical protein
MVHDITPPAVTARSNGTTRIRMQGRNIGAKGTRIIFLNSVMKDVSSAVFTDCDRGLGYALLHSCLRTAFVFEAHTTHVHTNT